LLEGRNACPLGSLSLGELGIRLLLNLLHPRACCSVDIGSGAV
jgi:hypothetical protein